MALWIREFILRSCGLSIYGVFVARGFVACAQAGRIGAVGPREGGFHGNEWRGSKEESVGLAVIPVSLFIN